MEVTSVNLLLNRASESCNFEDELDATNDSNTETTDVEIAEQDSEDKKVNRLVEKQRLVKELARTQTFARHKNKYSAALLSKNKFGQVKKSWRRDEKSELESQNLAYNLSIVQTLGGIPFSSNDTVVIKKPIAITQPRISGERMVKWHIEAQLNASYQAVPRAFALSDRLFYETQKIKSYRVLYQNRYYLFEFEGGEMKEYCEEKHDRT
ncbi:hypothetical protein AB4151_03995 [Vibrio splendidus]|uniref:Uncharacterized protein n=1 Tax=Vibrio splendidus TaxID=29497 RepID=A0A2N7CHA7_VIBSP|nr:hypothetical protein [Vibrio splendidus]PMF25584.1 hypothetical protein BCV19_00600 [Vibrio splendidus]